MEEHQKFVTEALEKFQDLPSLGPHARSVPPIVSRDHSNAVTTWLCDEYMHTVIAAEHSQRAYVQVIIGMLDNYLPYALAETGARDEPIDLPDWFGSPEHIAAECHAMSHRIVKGALGEMLAAKAESERGATVMMDKTAKRFAAFDGKLDKKHGIDMIVVHDNGDVESIQVKSSRGEAQKYSGDADTVLIVDIESGEVKPY
jgi:hypothetical protein